MNSKIYLISLKSLTPLKFSRVVAKEETMLITPTEIQSGGGKKKQSIQSEDGTVSKFVDLS